MRRRLGAFELGVLFILVTGCSDSDDSDSPTSSSGGAVFQHAEGLAFAEPAEIRSDDGVTEAELESRERDVDVSGGNVRGTVYNDAFVGPTLRVSPGESLHVRLVNRLQQHTNIHYHGMHVSPEGNSDNIFLMVKPGESYDYVVDVPADHDVGTFWYHSHMHMGRWVTKHIVRKSIVRVSESVHAVRGRDEYVVRTPRCVQRIHV